MEKANIHVFGANHISRRTVKELKTVVSSIDFDIAFTEGVDYRNSFTVQTFMANPFLFVSLMGYFSLLKIAGKDVKTLEAMAREKDVPIKEVDVKLNTLTQEFSALVIQRLMVIPIFTMAILLAATASVPTLLEAIGGIILSLIGYLLYFVSETNRQRENHWAAKIEDSMKRNDWRQGFFMCGSFHVIRMAAILKDRGFSVTVIN